MILGHYDLAYISHSTVLHSQSGTSSSNSGAAAGATDSAERKAAAGPPVPSWAEVSHDVLCRSIAFFRLVGHLADTLKVDYLRALLTLVPVTL